MRWKNRSMVKRHRKGLRHNQCLDGGYSRAGEKYGIRRYWLRITQTDER